jgi:hypothetical protein
MRSITEFGSQSPGNVPFLASFASDFESFESFWGGWRVGVALLFAAPETRIVESYTTIDCHKRDISQSLFLSLLSRLAICPNVQIPRL